MKTFYFSIAFIFFVSTAFADPSDSVYVIISGDTVHIWNDGANENCGCLFRMDVALSNDTIYVTEVDTASEWAYCYCNFDLCASVTGLQSGNYFVKVFRFMPLFFADSLFYIGSTQFSYGGSSSAFISKSYQSECYTISDLEEVKEYPTDFSLDQNFPNPFNPSTVIKYQLPTNSYVILKVYDLLGRELKTLVNEQENAGNYSITFTASNLSSGTYFYRIQAGNFVHTNKFIVLK